MAKNSLTQFVDQTKKHINKLKNQVAKLRKQQEKVYEEANPEPKKPRGDGERREFEVSFNLTSVAKATILVLALILLANFIEEIGEIILVFFVSILFAAALDPTVDFLEKYKIPRAISVIVIYLVLLFIIGFFISQLVPLLASQLLELAKSIEVIISELAIEGKSSLPIVEKIRPIFDDILQSVDRETLLTQLKDSLQSLGTQLQSFAGNTFDFIISIFKGIFNFMLVLILTFFLVIDERGVDKFFISLFPSKHAKYIIEKMEAVCKTSSVRTIFINN